MSRIDTAPDVPSDDVAADAVSPPVLSKGNRTAMRVVLAVIGVLVALGSLVSLGVLVIGLNSLRVVTDSQTLPADIRSLAIDTGDVPLAVNVITDNSIEEPRIDLRLLARGGDAQLAVADDAAGSRVTLSDIGTGFLWFKRTGEVRVLLPPDVARDLSVTVNQQAQQVSA